MNMKSNRRLFIFAGEKSGDLHGGHLAAALSQDFPNILIDGVAGPDMRSQGITGPLVMEDFEVMGLSDVILSLPKLYRQFYLVRDHIMATAPEAAILIDYPGFNLRLAKALRKKGYAGKIIQYVSPTVWAHGKKRIETMSKTLDLLLTIYPFEAHCFTGTSLNVSYVGNPLCEYIRNYHYDDAWQQKCGLPNSQHLIALFPGSREGEISRNLPIILESAEMVLKKYPETVFGISCIHPKTEEILKKLASTHLQKALFCIPTRYTYELMRDSRSAIAKSGTVTLELALHNRPTVVIYQLSILNRIYAKYYLKLNLPHYCIVNILAQKTAFPELIESGLTPQNLYKQFQLIDQDGTFRQECFQTCSELAKTLEANSKASSLAAEFIKRLISC